MKISTTQLPQYKYYLFLSMLSCTILLICDIIIYKIVSIGPWLQPASSFIYPITYCLGDIIAEVYGYQCARRTIWTTMFCHLIFCFLLFYMVKLPSPSAWPHQHMYKEVFDNLLRTGVGSFIGIPAGYFVNAYMISKFKLIMHGKRFWLRSLIATGIGEAVMHVITYFAQFFPLYDIKTILSLIVTAWIYKCAYAVIAVIPVTLTVYFLKKKEGINVFDYNISYNPFSLTIEANDNIEKPPHEVETQNRSTV